VSVCAAELSVAVLDDVAVEVCMSVDVSVESEDRDVDALVWDAMVELDVWRIRVSKDSTDSDSI
jgi:hypothetical protein